MINYGVVQLGVTWEFLRDPGNAAYEAEMAAMKAEAMGGVLVAPAQLIEAVGEEREAFDFYLRWLVVERS